jgi:ABC-2 type transport system ATP-binding protein
MIAAGAGIPSRRVDEVLDLVGLGGVAKKRAGGFSLGMSQRLGLAGALLGNPAALMLDEPANGLDPEGVRWLRELLRLLAAEGRTILVSSHLLNEMTHLADALIVIGGGQLIAAEPMTDFVARHSRSEVVARADQPELLLDRLLHAGHRASVRPDGAVVVSDASTDAVAALAMSAGVLLYELAARQTSLEEAFFNATSGTAQYQAQPIQPATQPYSAPRR